MENTKYFVNLGDWKSNQLDINLDYFPPNPTYEYKTFHIVSKILLFLANKSPNLLEQIIQS